MAQGKADQQAANFQAAQLDIKAKEEQAAGQQDAEEFRRQKALKLSRGQAVAAAGGFTATDPTALALADEISEFGELQEALARSGGKSRRRGLEDQALATRISGRAARTGSFLTALGQGFGSIGAAGTILGNTKTLARYATKPFNPEPA